MNERAKLTRHTLYESVWAQPMTKVAAGLGISDVGLKKICIRHHVPVPGLGYWAKVAAGKTASHTNEPRRKSLAKKGARKRAAARTNICTDPQNPNGTTFHLAIVCSNLTKSITLVFEGSAPTAESSG